MKKPCLLALSPCLFLFLRRVGQKAEMAQYNQKEQIEVCFSLQQYAYTQIDIKKCPYVAHLPARPYATNYDTQNQIWATRKGANGSMAHKHRQ